jgi:hypothetical protein
LNTDVISERAAQAMSDAANITHTCVLQPENNAFEKDVVYAEIARAAEILAAKEIWGVAETAESVAAELRKLIEARLLFL